MKYRQNNNAMFLCAKINTTGETMGDDMPNVFANNGKMEGLFRCQRDATVNLGNELNSPINSLGLIPRTCFTQLCTDGTMKKSNWQTQYLILARAAAFTSLHGTTSFGLTRWSAKRRSSSVFCASVNDGTAPRLTIPSQIASTSSIRPSMLSTRACCKSCVFIIWTPFKTNRAILTRFATFMSNVRLT